jgi:hypothetical protein
MCTNDNPTTTRAVVTDYFNWRLKAITNNNRLFFIVRKIATDCEASYYSQQPTLNFHYSSSSLVELANVHHEIANELFNDGIITWTRIITLISFSAILVERLRQQQQNIDLLISSMIDWTTNFINTNLRSWLESQNYWVNSLKYNRSLFNRYLYLQDGCLKIYDKTPPQRRNSISRYAGIFGTIGKCKLRMTF